MIGTVKQEGSWIKIYDENGIYKASISACDGLVGFTGSTVSVKEGSWTKIYDENGNYKSTVQFSYKSSNARKNHPCVWRFFHTFVSTFCVATKNLIHDYQRTTNIKGYTFKPPPQRSFTRFLC